MKKEYALWTFLLLACFEMQAQIPASGPIKSPSSTASLDIQLPVGIFARSQFAGAGLNYSWSHHRFGMDASPSKWIGLTVNAGGDYYLGKKTNPSGYDFR